MLVATESKTTARTLLASPVHVGDHGAVSTMIALLRGVNVGGVKLPMAELRRICADDCGFGDVRTYVQSGNAVFTTSERSASKVAAALEEALERSTGRAVDVTVRTAAQMRKVVDANPYADRTDDPTKVHVAFLIGDGDPGVDWFDPAEWAPEELHAHGREVYLHLPDGMGRSKLAAEMTKRGSRKGATRATVRNWRTVLALKEMSA